MSTWFVRPAGGSYRAEDGTSYDDAWDGLSNIVYGASGFNSGDTLNVGEEHTITSDGTSLKIIGQTFATIGTVTGGVLKQNSTPGYDYTVRVEDTNNVRFKDVDIRSAIARAMRVRAQAANVSNVVIDGAHIDNNDATAASAAHCLWFTRSAANLISDVLVKNFRFTNAGAANVVSNSDGINLEGCDDNIVIEDGESTGNESEGIDISSGQTGLKIHRIRTHNNTGFGMKLACSSTPITGAEVVAIVSWENSPDAGSGKGIAWQDTDGSTLAQGTFYTSSVTGTCWQTSNPNSGNSTLQNCKFHNNIFVGGDTFGVGRHQSAASRAAWEATHTQTGNLYWQLSADTNLLYWDNDVGNTVTEANFSTWQASHASELNLDPLLRDPTNGDLRLEGNSPCIAAGVEWWSGEPPNGEDGQRFCMPPSMGAYEYYGGGACGSIPVRVKPAGIDVAKARSI